MKSIIKPISKSLLILICITGAFINQSYAQNKQKDIRYDADTLPHYPNLEGLTPEQPRDIKTDLNHSFPEPGAIVNMNIGPYFKWKEGLYERTGIQIGASYHNVFSIVPQSHLKFPQMGNTAGAGVFAMDFKWTPINKGKDWEGSLNVVMDVRHGYGDISPMFILVSTGIGGGVDMTNVWSGATLPFVFWEQKFKKDRAWIRAGYISPLGVLDFNRFKDNRVAFSNSANTVPWHVLPMGASSVGVAFNWKPIADSELYVSGIVQDNNQIGGIIDWGGLRHGTVVAGLEVGKHWVRGANDFDHLHATVMWTDRAAETLYSDFSEPGWSVKVHGSKQWGNVVGFANGAWSNITGGAAGAATLSDIVASAGVALLQPFNIQGELNFAINYSRINPVNADKLNNPTTEDEKFLSTLLGPLRTEGQWQAEVYWKMLLFPDMWLTPGAQFVMNPSFNPANNFVFAPTIKARYFF
ncbi:carbohydrate porin [Sediminitomix flava]|uniref:carbohydrate porin n=1 Tax=Sediminitomix flava TaxID=379075 RepID=UPI001304C929|nr:carbohydrate porin [Sediminitomix flava]